jgi:uncharacterized protein with HEPN domain
MKPDKPTSKERIEHAIKAIDSIQTFIKSKTLKTFLEDEKTISACLYQFSIIGEATFQVEYGILEKYKYPWHKVKSFRNFILHEYHGIEMRVVWDTITELLPGLKELLQKVLKNEF